MWPDFFLMARIKNTARRQVEAMGWEVNPLPPNPYAGWAADVATVEKTLQTSIADGLTDEEVETRRNRYGPNELEKEAPTPFWKLVLEQVNTSQPVPSSDRDTMHYSDQDLIASLSRSSMIRWLKSSSHQHSFPSSSPSSRAMKQDLRREDSEPTSNLWSSSSFSSSTLQ